MQIITGNINIFKVVEAVKLLHPKSSVSHVFQSFRRLDQQHGRIRNDESKGICVGGYGTDPLRHISSSLFQGLPTTYWQRRGYCFSQINMYILSGNFAIIEIHSVGTQTPHLFTSYIHACYVHVRFQSSRNMASCCCISFSHETYNSVNYIEEGGKEVYQEYTF